MRRIVLIAAAAIVGAAATLSAAEETRKPASADIARAREARQRALECYGRKDWGCFLDRAREAQALDPVSTRLLYILACAVISFVATALLPDYTNRDVSREYDGV